MTDWITIPGVAISPSGTTFNRVFRKRTHEFGDGYTAVIPDGINNIPASYTLAYTLLLAADQKTLLDFIKLHMRQGTSLTVPILLEGDITGATTGLFRIEDYTTNAIEQGVLFEVKVDLREVFF